MLQVVLSPIEGGPAARAGILSGDELVQIDGNLNDLSAPCSEALERCFPDSP